MDSRPIGIYDSGMGGITLWRTLRRSMPSESLLYLGDGANCPYGSKSRSEIIEIATLAVDMLFERGCKLVVIACNTATAAAVSTLRSRYPDKHIVGMEPAIKPACLLTQTKIVGVLATESSLSSELFNSTMAKYGAGIEVITRVGEGFVELVESGEECSDRAYQVAEPILEDMIAKGVDKIVLGCTHYPFLLDTFERIIAGRNIEIIDPSPAIAARVEYLLGESNALNQTQEVPHDDFLTFADDDYRKKLIYRALR